MKKFILRNDIILFHKFLIENKANKKIMKIFFELIYDIELTAKEE